MVKQFEIVDYFDYIANVHYTINKENILPSSSFFANVPMLGGETTDNEAFNKLRTEHEVLKREYNLLSCFSF